MKLIIDMNLSPLWVNTLNQSEINAIHWSELGKLDAPDSTILAYALEHNCIVLTHDLDFSAILASTNIKKASRKPLYGCQLQSPKHKACRLECRKSRGSPQHDNASMSRRQRQLMLCLCFVGRQVAQLVHP